MTRMLPALRLLVLVPVSWILASGDALSADPPSPETAGGWPRIRTLMFEGREIEENASGVIELDAPARAENAAIVPIGFRTHPDHRTGRYVKKVTLVIDRNPSPVGAIFTFSPDSGRTELETRVRIETFSHVRAIAETSDGKLYMASRFVQAAGGCSAPMSSDAQASTARLGRMKLLLEGETKVDVPARARLMISHPNQSGLAMDLDSRGYQRPHYVRSIAVTYAGRPVMTAEVDFTISENPHVRFFFLPRGPGELKAEVVDTDQLKFESAIQVSIRSDSGN